MEQKNRLLTPLIIAAAASVVTFSSIGVAAITGHLPIAQSNVNPFSAFAGAPLVSLSAGIAPIAKSVIHQGWTRSAGESSISGKPVDFHRGARVPGRKPTCPNCGVVDSIRLREARTDDGKQASPVSGMSGNQYVVWHPEIDSDRETGYVVTVRMENGTFRTIHENERPPFSIGKRVKLMDGSIIPLG